jgi:2-iminobutanoate/2-iminopropanoate deaminase
MSSALYLKPKTLTIQPFDEIPNGTQVICITMHREVLFTAEAPPAIGPYSQAIRAVGSFVFLSGQIPLKPDGTLVEGDVKAQAEQVLANLCALLTEAGLTTANVVKTTIFLSSMDHFSAVNEVYGRVFAQQPPARSTVAVAGLPRAVDVEIEAVAVY